MITLKRKLLVAGVGTLLVAIIAVTIFYFFGASQYFSLDVNPSIEIETNRLDKVVNIHPLNAEAQTLLAGYRGNNKNMNHVVEDLVDRMILQGFIGTEQENDILITVKDDTVSAHTLDKVNSSIASYLDTRNVKANLYSQKMNWDENTKKTAELAGVSPGKMNLAEQVADIGDLSRNELAKMKVSELLDYADSNDVSLEHIEGIPAKQAVTEVSTEDIEDDLDNVVDEDFAEEIADQDDDVSSEEETTETPATPATSATTGGPIDETGARAIFSSYYPGIEIQKVERQDGGKKFYLHSYSGGVNYKMNVLTADGSVVYNYPAATGIPATTPAETSTETETPTAPTTTGGPVDEAGARAIFSGYYPSVPIQKLQLQDSGKKYYVYGELNGKHYKMNILTADGTVVYNNAGGNGKGNQANAVTKTPAESEIAETPASSTGGSITEADAKATFASYFPGVSIQTIELQDSGSAYYMYGESDGTHYKMKIRVSDGSVLFSNSGGGGNRGGNNNGNKGGRR